MAMVSNRIGIHYLRKGDKLHVQHKNSTEHYFIILQKN